MSLDQIHTLVRQYDSKDQRRLLAFAVTLLLVGAVGAWIWTATHDPILTVLLVGGELTTLSLACRWSFVARDPAEPAGEFLRRRLLLRLQYLQGRWLLAVLPLVPCLLWVGWLMYQHSQLPLGRRLAPFVVLVLTAAWLLVRVRQRARRVKADLDELNGLMPR